MLTQRFDEECLENVADLDSVRDAVSKRIVRHNVKLATGKALNARFKAYTRKSFSLMTLGYGAPVDINVSPPPNQVHVVQIPLRGSARVASGRAAILSTPEQASLPDPTYGARMSWSVDCEQLIVRLDGDDMKRHLQSMIGGAIADPVHFALGMDLRAPRCKSWLRAIQLLLRDVRAQTGIMDHPLLAPQIESMLFTGLLLAQPHNYSDQLVNERDLNTPRHIREVIRRIEEHPDLPLTIEELADESGISIRALQKSFLKTVGRSPMAYLKEIRLRRAHDDLVGADPRSGVTVTDIALKWGFMHLGRFSVSYRERFGESPSMTLRR